MLCHMIPSQPVSALRNKQINNKNQNKINYKDIPVEGTYQLQRYTSGRDISICNHNFLVLDIIKKHLVAIKYINRQICVQM